MRNFVSKGDYLTYANGATAITSGSLVVVGKRVGIAVADIAANASGELAMSGIYSLEKDTSTAFAMGALATWDTSASKLVTPGSEATGDISNCFHATKAALAADTHIDVAINVTVATVT